MLVRGTLLLAGGYVIHEIIDEGETGECDNGQCPAAENNDDWVSPVDDVGPDPLDYPGESDADRDPNKKDCQALKNSILKTCSGLKGRKKFSCWAAASKAYRQCMGLE
ncbi:hypothetical protein NBRC116587_35610 [Pseudoteredinibacter isoporae]